MYLTNTTETIQVILSGAVATNESVVTVDYGENTSTTFVAGKQRSVTNGSTAVDILSAPAASTQRIVQLLTMTNQDTAPITVTIRTNNAGTLSPQFGPVTLQVGERVQFATDTGFSVFDSAGAIKLTNVSVPVSFGTYIPVATNITNVASSTAYKARWSRVGNVVMVSGTVDIDPTASGVVALELSLPIASNFVNTLDLAGTTASPFDPDRSGTVVSNGTTDRASLSFTAGAIISLQTSNYIYSYEVL